MAILPHYHTRVVEPGERPEDPPYPPPEPGVPSTPPGEPVREPVADPPLELGPKASRAGDS
jgi:hypothetical protein